MQDSVDTHLGTKDFVKDQVLPVPNITVARVPQMDIFRHGPSIR